MEGEEGEEGDEDDAQGGDWGGAEEAEEAPVGPAVSTAGVGWGAAALAAAQAALEGLPGLQLYSFRTFPAQKRLDVRLDKLSDPYGSPSIDDIEAFARAMGSRLEAALGVEAAGDISMEAGSAGAERLLRLPGELERFATLPMRVEYNGAAAAAAAAAAAEGSGPGGAGSAGGRTGGTAAAGAAQGAQAGVGGALPAAMDGAGAAGAGGRQEAAGLGGGGPVVSKILELEGVEGGVSEWRLAEVKANAPAKGRGLTRRQRTERFRIPLSALLRVRLYVDF